MRTRKGREGSREKKEGRCERECARGRERVGERERERVGERERGIIHAYREVYDVPDVSEMFCGEAHL